jgi:hypothetical protein
MTLKFNIILCRGIPEAEERTPEDYDLVCDRMEADETENPGSKERKKTNSLGVKERCIFNSLRSFHCIGQMPFDVMHDWLEKVAPVDCQSVLLAFQIAGIMSLEAYNVALSNLRLEAYEVGDRPLPVKAEAEKLAGKALSVALHVRLMPDIICSIAEPDEECELVQFLVTLHTINEFMMADCFSPSDAYSFQSLTIRYFSLRQLCSEKYPGVFTKLVPKHHYIEHYAQQMLAFGPFTSVWTARYEARHRDFVNWCESSKNFVNVLKTLCIKNQKKLASRLEKLYPYSSVIILVRYQQPLLFL